MKADARGSDPLARAMGPVARELLGEPNARLSSKTESRYGTNGSLSIDIQKGTWFDHEAGIGGGVLDFLRTKRGMVNGAAMTWLQERGHIEPRPAPESAHRRPRIVATYQYRDADGILAFEVVRFHPKDFKQRRPDPATRSGWAWNMRGVELVPYRLPELLDAIGSGEPVCLCEGEKAADRLAQLGLAATCLPGGGGKKEAAYALHAKWFTRADLIILPDADQTGRQHAARVARAISSAAYRIRVLELPGLPERGDPFDWAQAGGTAEQLEALADAAPDFIDHTAPERDPPLDAPSEPSREEPPTLTLVDPTMLAGVPIPPREWIVEDWMPVGHVTLNYGDGGVGKTLLSQQLMTACAAGVYWCGLTVQQCRVFALFCEDDEAEVHRRQDRINAAYGLDWSQLRDLRWACAVGEDNVLVRFDADGTWHMTARFAQLVAAAKAFGAKLLIIDTAADVFGGNENDRQQVRAFLGPVLTKLAREIGGAVLLNAHPSRSGLSGDMDGGSTAWSNTARSRWALTRPPAEEGAEPDENLRILSMRKANYSARGEEIELRWRAGAFMPVQEAAPTGFAAAARSRTIEELFLTLLDRCTAQNVFVSISKNAHNFAPKVFAKRPERDGCTRQDFDQALNRLLADGRVTNEQYGRKHDEHYRLARVAEPATPNELEAELAAD